MAEEGIHRPSLVDTAVVDYALAVVVTRYTKIPLVVTTIGVHAPRDWRARRVPGGHAHHAVAAQSPDLNAPPFSS